MSEPENSAPAGSKKLKVIVVVLLALAGGTIVLCLWFAGVGIGDKDRLFRGKPESEWIKNLKYNDNKQAEEWRAYGKEGVEVLIRGWERADLRSHRERAYVRAYQRIVPHLPRALRGRVPAVKSDTTYSTRMCLVDLLSRLGDDANRAAPAMARALKDPMGGVRMIAISFFTWHEDENARLNQMPEKERRALLPEFVRLMRDPDDKGVRNNAAIALRYYRAQRDVVAPVLTNALRDPDPHVRLVAAIALKRVAPDEIAKAGVAAVLIEILKNPDDQIAYQAAQLLGETKSEPGLAVPALVEGLRGTNVLVACTSAQALANFVEQADKIIPALEEASSRKDPVGGRAKWALSQIQSASQQQ